MNTREILANYVLRNVGDSALIDMALTALAEGYDSEHLCMLADEDRENFNAFEVRDLCYRVLEELDMSFPSPQEAARVLICYWARCIVNGDVMPREGARHITYDVYRRFPDSPQESYVGESLDLGQLIGLYYEYDDLQEGFIEYQGRPLTKDEARSILDAEIVSEATRYLERHCA